MDPETDDQEPIVSGPDKEFSASEASDVARPNAGRKPAAKKPAVKATTAKKPAVKPSAQTKAAAQTKATAPRAAPTKPAPTKPAATKPAAKKPVASKPAAAKPAAKQSAATKPAAVTTSAPRPVAKKSPARKPAAASVEKTTAERAVSEEPQAPITPRETVLRIDGLSKHYGTTLAVDDISLSVSAGTIFGIVGPNGAGKTTTLSMVTGLLRPDAGTVHVHGIDVWADAAKAKRNMGVLPDRLRLFDRLTGSQLLYYSGVLRGLSAATVKARSADLAVAFGLDDALDRLVTDYSAGMTKKIALATAMLHSPRLLVLDEPFESVDPVSAANIIEILQKYTDAGGTVVLSSHSMDLIQRICDSVAIIVDGKVLASGTMRQVRGSKSLEERFVELAGGRRSAEGMEWLHSFSD